MKAGNSTKGLKLIAYSLLLITFYERNNRMICEKTTIETVREELQESLVFQSQTAIASAVGVSTAAISQFVAGKYRGDNNRLAKKLLNYLQTQEDKAAYTKQPEYIRTAVATKIELLIKLCISFSGVEGKIGVVTGDGGHGKSHCAREYARNHPGTVYVMLDDCMHTKAMFAAIAKEIGAVTGGNLGKITDGIVETLKDRETVVLLDEASSLTVGQLNKLRQIIVVRAKKPLVLLGNKDISRTLSLPTTRYGYESLDQFTSRMMASVDLDALAAAGELYGESDLRGLFEYGDKRLTADAVDCLQQIARVHRSGRLRICSHIIAALHSSAAVKDEITTELIIAAIEQLGLPVRPYLPLASIIAKRDKGQGARDKRQEGRVAV